MLGKHSVIRAESRRVEGNYSRECSPFSLHLREMPEGLSFKLMTDERSVKMTIKRVPQLGSVQPGLQSNYFQPSAHVAFPSIYRIGRAGGKPHELVIQSLASVNISQQKSYWDFEYEIIDLFLLLLILAYCTSGMCLFSNLHYITSIYSQMVLMAHSVPFQLVSQSCVTKGHPCHVP